MTDYDHQPSRPFTHRGGPQPIKRSTAKVLVPQSVLPSEEDRSTGRAGLKQVRETLRKVKEHQ